MPITWITLLTFAGTSLLVLSIVAIVYDAFFRYRFAVQDRVEKLTGGNASDQAVSIFKEFKELQQTELNLLTWRQRIQQLIEQSGTQLSLSHFFLLSWAIAVLSGGFGWYWTWWLGFILAPAGALLPWGICCFQRHARQQKLCNQLPEAFATISRAVRAGQTIPAAMQIIAEEFEAPISTEFALCYEQQNLGMSRETALRKFAMRSGIMDLQLFVVALLIQAKSGGNLVEMLDNLALMIRKRMKLKDRVKALTGEGRMQALVLILLPMIALFGLMILSPEYAQELLDRPWLLGVTAAAQFVGTLWIRSIVNFEY